MQESLRYVKGVGPKKEALFAKLGLHTVHDLLHYFPFRYEDRRNFRKIKDLNESEFFLVKGKVMAKNLKKLPYYYYRGKIRDIFEVALSDSSATVNCVWFNQGYLSNAINVGDELVVYAKPRIQEHKLQFVAPEFEVVEEDSDFLNLGRIVPVYHLTESLSQRFMRKTIFNCLNNSSKDIIDALPFDIRQKEKFENAAVSLSAIHFPASFEEAELARRRFIFEELFFSQILVYLRKAKHRLTSAMPFKLDEKVKSAIRSNLNFTLTASQNQTVNEILLDLQKNYPMHRLLQGDVGCGKTVVCAFAFAASISSGFQAAFMVPTEILAYQHKETFENLFKGLNYKIEVLVSSLGAKSIATIVKGLEDGSIDMVIGTHALIQEKVTFKKLNFVAIDEQHRFGVAQRAILPKKGQNPHYLVMSATPIPRSLALTLYGDLDLSVIKELPQERIIPKTSWVSEEKRPWAVSLIKEQLSAGRQTFVIYPVIEESEDEDLKSLELEYERIKKEFFPFKAAIFHGRLKPKDKLSIARKFYEKEIDILISTTVVEVGVNVYNATTMLVENPERFGLAQLHQLRGRIQRSKYQPYFILISKPEINEEAKSRLGVIAAENDGFKIAEEDLKLRGPGDFFGFLQHGLPELKIANPLKDIELLKEARFEAYKIIKDDPFLEKRQHCQIKSRLKLWLPAVSEYFSEAKAAQG